jgi:hypothetical protein
MTRHATGQITRVSGRGSGGAILSGAGNKYLMLFGAKGGAINLNLAAAP